MLKILLTPWAWLPLPLVHALGALLGRAVYALAPRTRASIRENVCQAGLARGREEALCRAAAREMGKGVCELPALWLRANTLQWLEEDKEWHIVADAYAEGRGIIFLTPHLACWEIAAQHAAAKLPMTIMYRTPKLAWLDPLFRQGRLRGRTKLATADRAGVRVLLKALKSGETIGVLPDQAPSQGEGTWADFFGRPAYTMTLLARLQHATGARLIAAYAERLPRGRGYRMHWRPMAPMPEDAKEAARALNAKLEELIRECPAQYLWAYNRYKVPKGVRREG